MIRAAVLALLLALAACDPPPHATGYFKTHPQDASAVTSACASGAQRDQECANAQAALDQIKSEHRLNLYRRSF